jgi:hypothetical protein
MVHLELRQTYVQHNHHTTLPKLIGRDHKAIISYIMGILHALYQLIGHAEARLLV